MAIGSSIVVSWKRLEFNILSIETMFCLALGTSIPTVPLPGIGAMIRIPKAARLRAISSSRFLIFDIFTPSAGVISYNVIVGPTVAVIVLICTPKLFNTSTMRFLLAVCSFMSIYGLPSFSYFLSKSSVGYLYFVHGSFGFIGVLMFVLPDTSLESARFSFSGIIILSSLSLFSFAFAGAGSLWVSSTDSSSLITASPLLPNSTFCVCGLSNTVGSSRVFIVLSFRLYLDCW